MHHHHLTSSLLLRRKWQQQLRMRLRLLILFSSMQGTLMGPLFLCICLLAVGVFFPLLSFLFHDRHLDSAPLHLGARYTRIVFSEYTCLLAVGVFFRKLRSCLYRHICMFFVKLLGDWFSSQPYQILVKDFPCFFRSYLPIHKMTFQHHIAVHI